jgi:hypothetical protein
LVVGMFSSAIVAATAALIKIYSSRKVKKSSKPRIFLSYAREDEDKALNLCKKLEESGFTTWLDIVNLEPGDNWVESIRSAIHQSDFFVPLISRNTKDKRGYLQKELKLALDLLEERKKAGIKIVPVRLEESDVPEPLAQFHWLDIYQNEGFEKLKETFDKVK